MDKEALYDLVAEASNEFMQSVDEEPPDRRELRIYAAGTQMGILLRKADAYFQAQDGDTLALWRTEDLHEALRESVKMQSHYAELLNMHDGGKRMTFDSAEAWLERLAELKRKLKQVEPKRKKKT